MPPLATKCLKVHLGNVRLKLMCPILIVPAACEGNVLCLFDSGLSNGKNGGQHSDSAQELFLL